MEQARIFVSSTCYDLAQLRADLDEGLSALGHKVHLSELPSFPVDPDLGTIENCKRVICENTDILVLVVGGRRGSLDPATGKPVTNVEHATAVECDVDAYVFVQKPVLDLLPVWEKNPGADFSPHVDYPEVFEFIKRLREGEAWVFAFDKAQDIVGTLRLQLSGRLRDLLGRHRLPDSLVPPAFASETSKARRLLRDRPPYCEYLLAAELLRGKLDPIERDFQDLERGTLFYREHDVALEDSGTWLKGRTDHLLDIVRVACPAVNEEVLGSLGPPGQPGDPVSILRAMDRIATLGQQFLDWEVETRAARLAPDVDHLREMMVGWATPPWLELVRIRDLFDEVAAGPDPERKYELQLVFRSPDNLPDWTRELDRIAGEG